jgi:hypothetical protein
VSAAVGPVRAALAPPRGAERVEVTLVLLALAAIAGGVAAVAPGLLRPLFAAAFALALLTLCFTRPRAGLVATVGFLTALAMIRRLLIADAGWESVDPLLLVGPLVAAVLCLRIFLLEGRPIAPDILSKLVIAVLVMTGLQIFNPAGGSVVAGLVGFLFLGMPLLWFFVGRELVDESLADTIMGFVVALAVVVALYGLLQTQIGFPSWDRAWIDHARGTGYAALNVDNQVRAFGTFSSSAEYALFLGAALAFAAASVLRGRARWGLAIPILAVALFLASARSAFVLTGLAIAVLAALRPRRPALAVAVAVVALAVAYASVSVLGSTLSTSGNALVEHQVSGLTDPLNGDVSTLGVHVDLFVEGIDFGLNHPLGAGVGVIGQAAKLGSGNIGGSTEFDVSNAFVSSGLVGGLLYTVLLAVAVLRGIQGWFAGRATLLPILGIMVSTAGYWLIGGHYLLVPLTWMLIGHLARVTADLPSRPEAGTAQARAASPLPSPVT